MSTSSISNGVIIIDYPELNRASGVSELELKRLRLESLNVARWLKKRKVEVNQDAEEGINYDRHKIFRV
jgi:hypothetical protein